MALIQHNQSARYSRIRIRDYSSMYRHISATKSQGYGSVPQGKRVIYIISLVCLFQLTAEALLLMVNEPVLPFSALDVVLDVQNKLRVDKFTSDQLLAFAGTLRESAQLFQSDEMRPANDPKERDTMHVRMLNDVLQDLEKNFIIPQAPLGFYRQVSLISLTHTAAFLTQTVCLDDTTVKFEIWDTAGQERYHSLAPMYYRGGQAAIVVYDITNELSGTESILMQYVGDRDSVLNTAEEEEETEDADRGLLSKNNRENPEEECVPNLHILGVLFLSKYMSYAFNLLLVFQFISIGISYVLAGSESYAELLHISISIGISYVLAGSESYAELLHISYVYVIPFFTWILALGILLAQVVIQPVTSLLTLLKGILLMVTIMWFRRAIIGGLTTCAVLNVLCRLEP
ncbi:UNVERIFIED_CONTAM: hypothetical protein FKN15_028051 [Acipenser sinensis]